MLFPESDSILYRQLMHEQLRDNVKHRFWKGDDVKLATDVTIERSASCPS